MESGSHVHIGVVCHGIYIYIYRYSANYFCPIYIPDQGIISLGCQGRMGDGGEWSPITDANIHKKSADAGKAFALTCV